MGNSIDSRLPVGKYFRAKDINLETVPTVVLVVKPRLRTRQTGSPWRFFVSGFLTCSAVSMPWRGRRPSSGYLKPDGTSSRSFTHPLSLNGVYSGPRRDVHFRLAHSMRQN